MRFRIRHLIMLTVLAGFVAYLYTQRGLEYLEFEVMEIVDEGSHYSLMWSYRNCPVAESAGNFNTIEMVLLSPNAQLRKTRAQVGDVIQTQYRIDPVWPMATEEPWQAVLKRLGFDHRKRLTHNGIAVNG